MTESFDINTKLYSYDGILGRRDYCLNIIYITAIAIAVNIPSIIWGLTKCASLESLVRYHIIFWNLPIILILLSLFCTAGVVFLLVPTINRRVRDIFGKTNKYTTVCCSIILGIANFWFFLPGVTNILIQFIAFLTGLYLIFKPGKITSKLPYDYTKDFNWGAYFGTWIWGLYNKSYITLFIWALKSTPFCGLFQIYCGLKGNEWAYKGKKWNDVDAFNKSQRKQTIFFICLNFLIVPLLIFIPLVLIIILILNLGAGNCQRCPVDNQVSPPPAIEQKVKQETTHNKVELDPIYKAMANMYFASYDLSENEYKFYISENEWKTLTLFEKMELMNKAQKIAKEYRYRVIKNKYPNSCPYKTEPEEINKIKLYSTEKHQILGEYNDEFDSKKLSAKDLLKSILSLWKFY